jgi:hypothetical protein
MNIHDGYPLQDSVSKIDRKILSMYVTEIQDLLYCVLLSSGCNVGMDLTKYCLTVKLKTLPGKLSPFSGKFLNTL